MHTAALQVRAYAASARACATSWHVCGVAETRKEENEGDDGECMDGTHMYRTQHAQPCSTHAQLTLLVYACDT